MPAIRPHETETDTDSSWDGPAEVAAAPENEATLRYMHTWVDPNADPDTKTAYKFPHHKAGTDTAAVIAGVNNALARLSQADIPAGDRSGVERHLRSHREDAGLEDEESQGEDMAKTTDKKQPIRCFDGKQKPLTPFWNWKMAAEIDPAGDVDSDSASVPISEPELELYGYISEYSWWDDDITPKMFKNDLYKYGQGGPIKIRMNSYGGDVIAASLIYSMIKDYPGKVTVQIDGVAASAATVVAIAGDVVRMRETAYFMIHDPSVVFFMAQLNIEELTRMADRLQAVKEGIVNAYESRTGMGRTRLGRLMTEETWMDAEEARRMGFIDEVMHGDGVIGDGGMEKAAIVNAVRNFKHVPAALLNEAKPSTETTSVVDKNSEAMDELRAKVKLYL